MPHSGHTRDSLTDSSRDGSGQTQKKDVAYEFRMDSPTVNAEPEDSPTNGTAG